MNLQEEKACFMAMYLGCNVEYEAIEGDKPVIKTDTLIGVNSFNGDVFLNLNDIDMDEAGPTLILRPLKHLTDDEAIAIAKMIREGNSFTEVRQWVVSERNNYFITVTATDQRYPDYKAKLIIHTKWFGIEIFVPKYPDGRAQSDMLRIIDYLRSRGILIPWREYSTEQILEMGWVKVKEVSNES